MIPHKNEMQKLPSKIVEHLKNQANNQLASKLIIKECLKGKKRLWSNVYGK